MNRMVNGHVGHGRWLAVSIIIGLLAGLILPSLSPRVVEAAAPAQPSNVSPADGTTDISPIHPFASSNFSAPEGDRHLASQWQITRTPGNYSSPVFDSGLDFSSKTVINIPPGNLCLNTTYCWIVRHQNDKGEWSCWSNETSFKTIVSGTPSTPINLSPVNGAGEIAQSPTLESSAFVSLDGGATHAASRWQITGVAADYSSLVFDSSLDTANKTKITVPPESLSLNTPYYWRVRHQDSLGRWSGWSAQTSFATVMRPPVAPSGKSPANGATGLSVTPTLTTSAFADPDVLASHKASHWQITAASGDYSSPVYDTGADTPNKASLTIPTGTLSYSTTYYWHVRHQDSYGNWSGWSAQTSFTTMMQPPITPSNSSPANGATVTGVTPTLTSSAFSHPDVGDSHKASRWQIAIISGNYASPVYDSNPDTTNKTRITIPAGKLRYNTTYYWHVGHQDNYGNWSDWSAETSFTTTTQAPITPSNSSPANGATGISVTPTLTSSAFSDPDVGDSHKASQWQITAISGNYASPVYDSSPDTTNKTRITIPAGKLSYDTTYYWHVRHQDSYGNWSGYSPETAFTASSIKADFSAAPIQVAPGQTVTFSDNSTGDVTSWVCDFGDGATKEWTTRPEGGKLTHSYSTAGSYTVSLKVAGAAGKDTRTKASLILASAPHSGKGLPWIPIIIGIVIVLAGGGLFWYLRRRSLYYT